MATPYYITLLQEALPEIKTFFETSSQRVYKQIDLSRILNKYHLNWHIYTNVPVRVFVRYICEQTHMKRVDLFLGKSKSRKETRYLWGDASVFELALSLKNRSYFTHYTAAYLHGLTKKN